MLVLGIVLVLEDPRALTEVVEHQGDLDERPREVDVAASHVSHVGVQRLGAGGRQEHGAHDGDAGRIVRAEQEFHAVHGVERREHGPIAGEVHRADHGEEREPHQHHGAEHAADAFGAARLHGEQHDDDDHGDHQRQVAVFLEQRLQWRQRLQAFDRGADRHGRGEHGIGEERRAAEHGGDGEPCAMPANQRIQGEDAAFALVVDTHGDEHVFDGGDQRYRPEHQRQHAEHGLTVGVGDAALAGKERLRGVQGRCSDVAVDHAERDDGHAERDLVGAGLQSAPPAADRALACGLGEFFRFLGFCRLLLCKLFALLFRQCATGDFRDVGERVGT